MHCDDQKFVDHGKTCAKIPHRQDPGEVYVHPEFWDGPYWVGDLCCCGRCHQVLPVDGSFLNQPVYSGDGESNNQSSVAEISGDGRQNG